MKVFFSGLVIFLSVTVLSGDAHAGWFDGKKKTADKVVQTTQNQVKQQVNNVQTALSKTQAQASAPVSAGATASAKPQFLDIQSGGAKWDYEVASEEQRKDASRVRLSEEETEKVKEEMRRLQQNIRSAQEARETMRVVKSQTRPALPAPRPVLKPLASARPESLAQLPQVPAKPVSYKANSVPQVANYKQ